MCSPTKSLGNALGTIFTGGLNQTGLPFFKKAGDVVGTGLTLGTNKLNIGGGGGGPGGTLPSLGSGVAPLPMPSSDNESDRLAKIFGPVKDAQYANIDADTADALKKLRSSQAARGVLRSGISDYPTTEIQKAATLAKGNVDSGLANILGTTESQRSLFNTQADFLKQQSLDEYNRNLQLAKMISDANKPSTLSQIFGGASSFGPLLGSLFGSGGGLASIFGGGAGAAGAAELLPIGLV